MVGEHSVLVPRFLLIFHRAKQEEKRKRQIVLSIPDPQNMTKGISSLTKIKSIYFVFIYLFRICHLFVYYLFIDLFRIRF